MQRILIGLLCATCLLTACTPTRGSAADMLPTVPNTNVVEGQSITDFIAKLANGAAVTAGNPELLPVIEKVQSTLGCMQSIGAVAARTYTDKTFPLSAGAVVIIDRKAATNLANLQQCFMGSGGAEAGVPTLQPCVQTWTLPKGDNEFYIAYVASTAEMCAAFCAQLEGCPAK